MNKKVFDNYLDYIHFWVSKYNKYEWFTDTSTMDKDGKYTKYYNFSNGFQIIAVNKPVYREVTTTCEVEGIPFTFTNEVKLFQTEVWNTKDATSYFFYEKW